MDVRKKGQKRKVDDMRLQPNHHHEISVVEVESKENDNRTSFDVTPVTMNVVVTSIGTNITTMLVVTLQPNWSNQVNSPYLFLVPKTLFQGKESEILHGCSSCWTISSSDQCNISKFAL